MEQQREKLSSRLGFILLSAGCAIGVGNVWKFPWMCGQNGGGAFVLIYLIFLAILGLPVMTMEFSIGRAAQTSPARMYHALGAKKPWRIKGYASFLGDILLMMFYTSVAGWILYYFFKTASGGLEGLNAQQIEQQYGEMMANPAIMVGFMAIVVVLAFVILSFGLQKGLERITKYLMLILFAVMITLVVRSFTLEGAKEGLKFYLIPNFSKITPSVITGAMNQAFFTLSLGIGAMAIFGSYIGKERSLMGESVNIILLDTCVAIIAGLIIFPACFTYGIEPTAGPSLLFIAMANVFSNMANGAIWGALFFLFMFFAALSTVLAVCEGLLACFCDITKLSRTKSCIICCVGILVLSLPCALGFNLLSNINPFGDGTVIMDLEDFMVSNCLLPLGSLFIVIFCTQKFGWGWKNFTAEANAGKGLKVKNFLKWYCTIILPLIIIAIFVLGIIDFFKL